MHLNAATRRCIVILMLIVCYFEYFYLFERYGCSTTVFVWAALDLYNCVPIPNSSLCVIN